MVRRFASRRDVELIADPRNVEQKIWDEYSLALILPRRFPEHVSDADISATLRHVARTERLPWEIDL
jgi:hypothetical protein